MVCVGELYEWFGFYHELFGERGEAPGNVYTLLKFSWGCIKVMLYVFTKLYFPLCINLLVDNSYLIILQNYVLHYIIAFW